MKYNSFFTKISKISKYYIFYNMKYNLHKTDILYMIK